jgi:hypothetical protein
MLFETLSSERRLKSRERGRDQTGFLFRKHAVPR